MRYQDKVTIVTGGTKGIGEGCVEVFAEAGAHVVFCGLEPELGAGVAERVTAAGPGSATFIRCDVTRQEDREALLAQALARHGRLDCLINNAGLAPAASPDRRVLGRRLPRHPRAERHQHLCACKAALPHLRQSRGSS